MSNRFFRAALLLALMLAGCADTSLYDLRTPAAAQADRYVEAEGLPRLPGKRLALTSFGIESTPR